MEKIPKSNTNDLISAPSGRALQTGLISKIEVSKVIDKFKVLNKIIQGNIGAELINFTSSDLNDFKLIIFNLSKNFNKENMKYIICSSQKIRLANEEGEEIFPSQETRLAFTKYFILLISYLIHFSPQFKSKTVNFIEYLVLTLKLVKKLYKDNILLENDVSLISKFIILMSLFTTVMTDNVSRKGKNIKNVLFVWLSFSFFTSLFDFKIEEGDYGDFSEKENSINFLIKEFLIFINEILLINHSNIYILGDSTKFLLLLDLLKCECITKENKHLLLKSVVKVYGNKYDLNVLGFLMKGVKDGLVNISNKSSLDKDICSDTPIFSDLRVLDNNLEFLKTCAIWEKENSASDNFPLRNGFIMNDHLKTGISISPIISFPKKSYTLTFAFKWTPDPDNINARMNLVTFAQEKEKPLSTKEDFKDFVIMSIYIEDSKLRISVKENWDTDFIVQPNYTYLINVIQLQPGFFARGKSKISIVVNNQHQFTTDINGYPSGKMKCQVGFQSVWDDKLQKVSSIYHFNGMIGTIILFNELFTSEIINKLNETKSDYEKVLFVNYENISNVVNLRTLKTLEYFKNFEKFKFEQKVVMLISANSIVKSSCISSNVKTEFKENYAEFNDNKKLSMISRKFEVVPSTIVFENKDFLFQFFKLDGIKFLSLYLVYLNQIPKEMVRDNEMIWKKVTDTFINLLELNLMFFENSDTDDHLSSYDYFFFHMNTFIEQLSGSLFNCLTKYLSSMDINNEIEHYHLLRNKFAYLMLDRKLYIENDFQSLESLIAIFFSCLRHDYDGLISTQFMNKILSFSFIFDLKLKEEEKMEYLYLKTNYLNLIITYLQICIEKKNEEILMEYINYINLEETKSNVYMCYKLLKCLYLTNSKDALIDVLALSKDFNMNYYFLGMIEWLEYKYLDTLIIKQNSKEYKVSELLKALCIRFIDDYVVKNEKAEYSKSNEKMNSTTNNRININNQITLGRENALTVAKKSNYSPGHFPYTKQNKMLTKSTKIYKHTLIERIIEIMIPSEYTIRSLFLTIFYTPESSACLSFIKNSKESDLNFYSKDALVILVKLVERIANYQFKEEARGELELLKFIYDYISNFLESIIEKYLNNKNDKEARKHFNDIFESNKVCLKFYFQCINSYYLTLDEGEINSDTNETDGKTKMEKRISGSEFKENIKNSLITIIKRTIGHHQNPFYFNLLIALYTRTQEVPLMLDLLDVIITENVKNAKNKEVHPRFKISNQKNIVILLYRMIFMSIETQTKSIFFCKQFEEKIKLFFTAISSNQILYTKLRFNVAYSKKNLSNDGKQRTVLEMIFEMLLEMYQIYKEEAYIKLLEEIVIANKHSIFYYMDLYYFYPIIESDTVSKRFDRKILELIETNIFKEGSVSIFVSSYFFLVKTLVYIQELNYFTDSSGDKAFLLKLAKYITADIIKLLEMIRSKSLTSQMRVEIKDSLYVELKTYFEQTFIYMKEKDFFVLKTEFEKTMEQNKSEMKKYYKLTSNKLTSMLDTKLEISCKRQSREVKPVVKSNSSDSLIYKGSFLTNMTNTTELFGGMNMVYPQTNYNSNEERVEVKGLPEFKHNLQSTQTDSSQNTTTKNCQVDNLDSTRRPTTTTDKSKYKHIAANSNSTNLYYSEKNDKFNQFFGQSQISLKSLKTYTEFNPNILINISTPSHKNSLEDNLSLYKSYPATFKDNILCKPKKDLLLTRFGVFFKDTFFQNPLFVNEIKKKFEATQLNSEEKAEKNLEYETLDYPVKIKNIFNSSYMRLFLKPDTSFFTSKFLKISHDYFSDTSLTLTSNAIRLNANSFFQYKNLDKDLYNAYYTIETFPCEYVTAEGVIFGKLFLCKDFILFKSQFDENMYHPQSEFKYNQVLDYVFSSLDIDIIYVEKEFKLYYQDINEILNRRFLYMWQASEVFLKNGKSVFFNLFRTAKNQKFFRIMDMISKNFSINVIVNCKKYFKEHEYTKKWIHGELSNMDYLLLINKFSGRSFHDVNQYPVFPWVVSNYSEIKFNANEKSMLRNLSQHISVQSEEKRQLAIKKYEEEGERFKLHFRCHYSTSAFISYYLMRLTPFNHNLIKLQSFKFDHPNRMFNSIKETWEILEKNSDNRELTPEFFFQPEMLINVNYNNFGLRSTDNRRVNNLNLPDWASNPIDFICKHRSILESKNVSLSLHSWIDNIFGANQLIKNKENLNIFPKLSYEQEINLERKLDKYFKKNDDDEFKIVNKLKNKINIILNFGQTPHKLFDDKHPKKIFDIKQIKSDEYTDLSDYIKSKQKLSDFKKGVRYFNHSKTHIYILNGEREVEVFDKVKFIKKNKVRLKHFLLLNRFNFNHSKERTLPMYRLKYCVIDLKDTKYFLSCRHIDKSIKIYYGDANIKEVLCDSFVTVISKLKSEDFIFTGHDNGKLICWNVDYKKNEITINIWKEIIAHEDAVTCILVNENLNIIVTGGEDGYVYIRNLYDFEILGCIKPHLANLEKNLKIIDLVVGENHTSNLLYVTCFDHDKFILFGYTINGLLFCTKEGLFSNIEVLNGGKLIYGVYNRNKVYITDPVDFNKVITEKKLEGEDMMDIVLYFSTTIENNHLIYGYLEGNLKKCPLLKDNSSLDYFN